MNNFIKKRSINKIVGIFILMLIVSICLPNRVSASNNSIKEMEIESNSVNSVTPQRPLVYEDYFVNNGKIDPMPYNGNKVSISSLATDANGNAISDAYIKVKFYNAISNTLVASMDVNANGKVQSVSSNIISGQDYYFTYESNLKYSTKTFKIRIVSVVY